MRFGLYWSEDGGMLSCAKKDMEDTYNRMQQIYRSLKKNIINVVSSRPIKHSLVKCSTISK